MNSIYRMLGQVPAAAQSERIHAGHDPDPVLTSIDIWMLGGDFADVGPQDTAFGSRDVTHLVPSSPTGMSPTGTKKTCPGCGAR